MKLRVKRLLTPRLLNWVLLMGAALGLFCYKIGTLLPGMSAVEQKLPPFKDSLQALWEQPLELPSTLAKLLVAAVLPTGGITASRLPSVALGLLLVGLMYWLFYKWYGQRLAFFGTILLITAPWLLHVSRLATNDILYPLAMATTLILFALWHQKERSVKLLYLYCVVLSLLLYIPGGIWLVGCLKLAERKNMLETIKANRVHGYIAVLISLILLVPLGHALIADWHLYRALLGLPAVWPQAIDYLEQFVNVWRYIFIGGYVQPAFNLGGLPIVNVFIDLAFLVGLYLYAQHPKARRTRFLLALWLVGTILAAFNGPVSIMILLPIVFTLAAGGIGYLLHLWLRVFPRNPIARSFGIFLVGLVISFAVLYNVRNYYIAWPNYQATRDTFQQQP